MMVYLLLAYMVLFFAKEEFRVYTFHTGMVMLALSGFMNGFFTTRILKAFGATDWVFSAVVASTLLPIMLMAIISAADLVEIVMGASMPSSFLGGVGTSALWFFLNTTSSFIGAYYGYFSQFEKKKNRVGTVKKNIPPQPCYMNLIWVSQVFGLIQFASVFVEFRYMIESFWRD